MWDWLIVIGVEGDDGVTGPKAELLEMSSAISGSPTIWPSSSTIPWTQPPEHGTMTTEYKCVIGLGTDNNNTVRINQDRGIMSSEIVQLLTMFGGH